MISDQLLLHQGLLGVIDVDNQQRFFAKAMLKELLPFMDKDVSLSGKYLRERCTQHMDQIYYFPLSNGISLLQMIGNMQDEMIEAIESQLVIALYQIHKQKSLGRCFTLENILYNQGEITLSVYGFYPQLQHWPPEMILQKAYGPEIDIWLLGIIILQLKSRTVFKKIRSISDLSLVDEILYKNFQDNYLLKQMLEHSPKQRLSYYQLCQKVQPFTLQNELKSYYQNQFHRTQYNQVIVQRESITEEYLEFSVPQESFECRQLPVLATQHQQEDQSFLFFRNKNQQEKNKFPRIWQELHFIFYRHTVMMNLEEILSKPEQNSNIVLARYFIQKMNIVLLREIIVNLKDGINIIEANADEWELFITTSQSLKNIIGEMEEYLSKYLAMFKYNNYEKTMNSIKNFQLDIQELQLYTTVKRYITDYVEEDGFQELKIPFRLTLKYFYEVQIKDTTENIQIYSRLQFLIVCCMAINSVFSQDRHETMQQICQYFGLNKLNCPSQVEQYLLKAPPEQLFKLAQKTLNYYF